MFGWILGKRSTITNNPHLLGKWGEKQALKYLKKQGYKYVCKNFRCKKGEIDLIVTDEDTVVFLEDKTRSSETYTPIESAFTKAKMRHLRSAARYFVAKHKINNRPLRFDFVAIKLTGKSTCEKRHYKNAFI